MHFHPNIPCSGRLERSLGRFARRGGMGRLHYHVCIFLPEEMVSLKFIVDGINRHGRDNKIHVWSSVVIPATVGDSVPSTFLTTPKLLKSLDVNALNYCRFSLFSFPREYGKEREAFFAVPNLVESAYVGQLQPLESQMGINPSYFSRWTSGRYPRLTVSTQP